MDCVNRHTAEHQLFGDVRRGVWRVARRQDQKDLGKKTERHAQQHKQQHTQQSQ